jgi:thymidylate synthase (FAD)
LKIELLAHTTLNPGAINEYMDIAGDWITTDADHLAEFAGRSCYQSFHKPNPATARNDAYLKNILEQGHFSVLEHSSATFYVTGVSRALTHELIRHRHLSYSELSQRFVDVESADYIEPPGFGKEADAYNYLSDAVGQARHSYRRIVEALHNTGLTRKQIREAARAAMPNAMETRIVVTGNMRAWRDMLFKRYSVHADAEIREFAAEILRQLKKIAPGQFQDFPERPFE